MTIKLKNGEDVTLAIATGKLSTNFKAEMEALKKAAETILQHKEQVHRNIVLLTDALSVITALKLHRNTELNELREVLVQVHNNFQRVVIHHTVTSKG